MNRYFFAVITAIVLAGCQRQQTRIISPEDFPAIVKLTPEEIAFDRNNYNQLYVADSILIAFNAYADEETNGVYLDAYKLPSLDYLGAVARHGRGPGEFLFAEYEDNSHYYEDGELKILVFDQLRNTASIVNLSQTIKQQKTVVEKEIKFTKAISHPYLVDKETLLFRESNLEQTSGWYLYDIAKNEYKDIDPLLGIIDWSHSYRYNYKIAIFPENRSKAVVCHSVMNRISTQKISDNGYVLQEGEYSIFSNSLKPGQIKSEETAKIIYGDIRIIGSNIYALYLNQTFYEIYEYPEPIEVHFFDEHLTPRARYSTAEHMRFFAIDGINNTLYGVTTDGKYFRYILP